MRTRNLVGQRSGQGQGDRGEWSRRGGGGHLYWLLAVVFTFLVMRMDCLLPYGSALVSSFLIGNLFPRHFYGSLVVFFYSFLPGLLLSSPHLRVFSALVVHTGSFLSRRSALRCQ